MALLETDIQAAFDEEAGDAASLATDAEVRRWWNEGQARLLRGVETTITITWAIGDKTVALPADFVSVARLEFASGVTAQDFRVFGKQLVSTRVGGASAAGTARLEYWADRALLVGAGTSPGSAQEDYACIYYALHRFYRKLASNRVQFKRYSTLLGQNAVTVSDLRAESDRLLQDFVDARNDLPVLQPASFYPG